MAKYIKHYALHETPGQPRTNAHTGPRTAKRLTQSKPAKSQDNHPANQKFPAYGISARSNAWNRWHFTMIEAEAICFNQRERLRTLHEFKQESNKLEAVLERHEREYFGEFGISLQQGLDLRKEDDFIPTQNEIKGQIKLF